MGKSLLEITLEYSLNGSAGRYNQSSSSRICQQPKVAVCHRADTCGGQTQLCNFSAWSGEGRHWWRGLLFAARHCICMLHFLHGCPQCMQALSRPAPVCRQFSIVQAFHGRSNPAQEVGGSGMNLRREVCLVCMSFLHFIATQWTAASFGQREFEMCLIVKWMPSLKKLGRSPLRADAVYQVVSVSWVLGQNLHCLLAFELGWCSTNKSRRAFNIGWS